MYFYFSTDFPSAVKLGGVYFSTAYKSAAFLDLYPPYPLIEILPVSSNGNGYAFFLGDEFLNNPPENVTVTDMNGGYFIRFSSIPNTGKFKIIRQAKFTNAVITAFCDNGYKLSLETKDGFLAENYGFNILNAEFTQKYFRSLVVIFAEFTLENEKLLNVYDVTEKPKLIFSQTIQKWETTDFGFTVTENKNDIAKHVISSTWEITETGAYEKEKTVTSSPLFDKDAIPIPLIPYAFAEELLCGGNLGDYIAGEVKENAKHLPAFFGDFIGVTTPPLFREYDEVGLIYKKTERTYFIQYFKFITEDRKIIKITKL